MTIIEKAKQLKKESTEEQRNRFYKRLFESGRDWLDVETLTKAVGIKDIHIYELYEEWQMS